jgi:hypothetical protein
MHMTNTQTEQLYELLGEVERCAEHAELLSAYFAGSMLVCTELIEICRDLEALLDTERSAR